MPDESIPEFSEMKDEAPLANTFEASELELTPEIDVAAETRGATGSDPTGVASTPSGGSVHPVLRAYEKDVHDTSFELRHIESEIRDLIQDRDPVRKRKFAGTAKWHELEDDLISWRFTGRFDEDVLRRVQVLVSRRHYLFRHLKYLSSTRPVWNS